MERIGQPLSDGEDGEALLSESGLDEDLAELMRDEDDEEGPDEDEDDDDDEDEDEDQDESDPRMRELAEMQREMEGLEQLSAALASAGGPRTRGAAGAAGASGSSSSRLLSLFRSSRLFGNSEEGEGGDEEEEDEEQQRHPNVTCDGCHAGPMLTGRVMHCNDCPDFDLCSRCYADLPSVNHPAGHRFTPRRPAQSRNLGPSHLLLQMLESAMMSEALRRSVEERGEPSPEEMRARNEKRGKELLAKMPKEAWSETLKVGLDGFQAECALCLEDYCQGEEVLKLPCCHYFHEDCVRPWFGKSLLCPICNQAASSEVAEEGTETSSS